VNNKPLPIAAVRVSHEDRSPLSIHGCGVAPTPIGFVEIIGDYFPNVSPPTRADASFLITLTDDGASFGFSANVSRRMRANHGANPKGSKEGRSMNDAQTLVLIHAIAWPILIVLLSKTWNYA
jgi:hypothetical protein